MDTCGEIHLGELIAANLTWFNPFVQVERLIPSRIAKRVGPLRRFRSDWRHSQPVFGVADANLPFTQVDIPLAGPSAGSIFRGWTP